MATNRIDISLKNTISGSVDSIRVEFENDEYSRLHRYYEYFEDLLKAKIIQIGIPCSIKIQYKKGKGLVVQTELPSDEDIIIVLYKLRPFILNDEYASYNRITGILSRRVSDKNIQDFLKRQRGLYDGKEMISRVQILSEKELLNSDKMLFNWLNAFEYHKDQDKRAEIERLHKFMPLKFTKAIFLMLLSDKVMAIKNVACLVTLMLGKIGQLEL